MYTHTVLPPLRHCVNNAAYLNLIESRERRLCRRLNKANQLLRMGMPTAAARIAVLEIGQGLRSAEFKGLERGKVVCGAGFSLSLSLSLSESLFLPPSLPGLLVESAAQ